jgi:hypothetical protein
MAATFTDDATKLEKKRRAGPSKGTTAHYHRVKIATPATETQENSENFGRSRGNFWRVSRG